MMNLTSEVRNWPNKYNLLEYTIFMLVRQKAFVQCDRQNNMGIFCCTGTRAKQKAHQTKEKKGKNAATAKVIPTF